MLGTYNRGDYYLCKRLPVIFPGISKQPFWRLGLLGPLVQFSKLPLFLHQCLFSQLKICKSWLDILKTDEFFKMCFKVNTSESNYGEQTQCKRLLMRKTAVSDRIAGPCKLSFHLWIFFSEVNKEIRRGKSMFTFVSPWIDIPVTDGRKHFVCNYIVMKWS